MTVPAFTTGYGDHFQSSPWIDEHMIWDGPGMNPVGPFQQGFVGNSGYNGQWGHSGNRKDPTPYWRGIRTLLANKPRVFHQEERYSNGQNYLTQEWTRHLSRDFDPFYVNWPTQFDIEVADALAKAKTKALNKLSEGKAQFGVSVLEAKRTAGMVAANATTIIRGYKAWKHGNGVQFLQDLYRDRELAKRFLEFQYGWKPLMADIHAGVDLLNRGLIEESYEIEVKSAPRVNLDTGWQTRGDGFDTRWRCFGRAKVRIIASIRSSYTEYFNTLGFTNPAEIAWELVPFSFVVDWFVPVGSCLSALSASAGLNLSSRSQLHTSRVGIFEARSTAMPFNGYQGIKDPGYFSVGVEVFDRSPLYGSWPIPEIYTKGNPFSTPHILNAIALIGARF